MAFRSSFEIHSHSVYSLGRKPLTVCYKLFFPPVAPKVDILKSCLCVLKIVKNIFGRNERMDVAVLVPSVKK